MESTVTEKPESYEKVPKDTQLGSKVSEQQERESPARREVSVVVPARPQLMEKSSSKLDRDCSEHDSKCAKVANKSINKLDDFSSDMDCQSPGQPPEKMCRICHNDSPVDSLRSLCRCRGSVGLVHKECLEAWLSSSGSTCCELCGFQFRLEHMPRHRLHRAFWVWVTTEADRTQLLVDLVWFCLMTPFAALSGYLIYRSLNRYKDLMQIKEGQERTTSQRDEPTMVNLVLLMSCLTLAVYYAWAVAIVQYHVRWWYRWWLTTFTVTVIEPADTPLSEVAVRSA